MPPSAFSHYSLHFVLVYKARPERRKNRRSICCRSSLVVSFNLARRPQTDPTPDVTLSLPVSGSKARIAARAVARLLLVIWWRFPETFPGGRKASLDQSDQRPAGNISPGRPVFIRIGRVCIVFSATRRFKTKINQKKKKKNGAV